MRKLTDKELNKSFGNLEDHKYRHYNRSLECFVEEKEHFRQLMSTGKYIPYELAQQYAENYDKSHPNKPMKLSDNARNIINAIKLTADRHGNIKLGGRAIKALKEMGAIPSQSVQDQLNDIIKEDNAVKGGFSKRNEDSFMIKTK